MLKRIKQLLTSLLLIGSFAVNAQSDSLTVDQNKNKIDELNRRLERLTNGSNKEASYNDSLNYKIDLLFEEINKVKLELNVVKHSLEELKKVESSTQAIEKPTDQLKSKLTTTNSSISTDAFYVIIESDRTEQGAILKQQSVNLKNNVDIIRNKKGTWFHLVINTPFSIKEIGNETQKYRNQGFSDAWWISGKNLNL